MSIKRFPAPFSHLPRGSRRGLVAGALALGIAGALTAQTVVPGQFALADPVRGVKVVGGTLDAVKTHCVRLRACA